MGTTYKSAGVDIAAGDETVKRIKKLAKGTFNQNVLSDIGLFGAFFKIDLKKYVEPVLVSSVDGVGTKLKIAIQMDKHDTIGQDLVNHCVNDIAVCGAKPLFFLDYMAFGKLDPLKAEQLIKGFSIACKNNGCALIGGETAEMPGLYEQDDYDISGTIVGIAEKSSLINGRNIKKGDILIGFPSNGLHTNGYSLARKILLDEFTLDSVPDGFKNSLGNELLKVHKSYLYLISQLTKHISVKGFSHITGGGIVGNTMRLIPKGLVLDIFWDNWQQPKIFKLIQTLGNVNDEEMQRVFNLGVGLISIVSIKDVNKVMRISKQIGTKPIIVGEVI
ncbi:MAG: phosphoribosylformylglycinamidine cyclo-ligase [Ignavibacteriaceae bacterium]|nr:phosphoribosylformylglycinamidine cyclo-ligase [Ignavibacteriaceae bacterium]